MRWVTGGHEGHHEEGNRGHQGHHEEGNRGHRGHHELGNRGHQGHLEVLRTRSCILEYISEEFPILLTVSEPLSFKYSLWRIQPWMIVCSVSFCWMIHANVVGGHMATVL